MSIATSLAEALLLLALEVATLAGAPVTPKQVEEVLRNSNRAEIAEVQRNEGGDDED